MIIFHIPNKLLNEMIKYQGLVNELRMLRNDLDEKTIVFEVQKIASETTMSQLQILNQLIILVGMRKCMPWEKVYERRNEDV